MSITTKPIIKLAFPTDQYIRKVYNKIQIVGHHTVAGTAKSSINWWLATKSREGTPIVIDRNGTPYQIYGSQFYAGHIGDTTEERNAYNLSVRNYSRSSIGVELASWGGLKKENNRYINWYGNVVNAEVVHYSEGYRGYYYFEKYSNEQIETFRELILYWGNRYNIPLIYNEDIWDVTPRALKKEPGLFVHSSFRFDKSDLHPQEEMIEMFKSLT